MFPIWTQIEQKANFLKIRALKNTFCTFYGGWFYSNGSYYAIRMKFGMPAIGIRCETWISECLPPKSLPRRKGGKKQEKIQKTAKNGKNPVLMGSYHKNNRNLCLEQVSEHFRDFLAFFRPFSFFH